MTLFVGVAHRYFLFQTGGEASTVSLSIAAGGSFCIFTPETTPGCSVEACAFRDSWDAFAKHDAVVLGVSADSESRHKKFSQKYRLPFPLLSDEQKNVLRAYGVWGEKSFLGKHFLGIRRTTFLISPSGRIVKRYDRVKPPAHAKDVLTDLLAMQKSQAKK